MDRIRSKKRREDPDYRVKHRQYYLSNREYYLNESHKRYLSKKDEIKEYNREYYLSNKNKILNNVRDYYKNNKTSILEYRKQYLSKCTTTYVKSIIRNTNGINNPSDKLIHIKKQIILLKRKVNRK